MTTSTDEFNLSDKIFIQPRRAGRAVIMQKDVKEFIAKLKRTINEELIECNRDCDLFGIPTLIDKLAGDKLI